MRMTDNNQKIPTTTKNSQDADISLVTCFSLDIKLGDIVIREGSEYEVDSVDEDGVCMGIINDDECKYIMADDCEVIKRNCR